MKTLTKENKLAIKKVQSVLFKIDTKQKVFFNIVEYQKMGLVKGRNKYYKDSSGNKQRLTINWFLTDKGKQILNTIL